MAHPNEYLFSSSFLQAGEGVGTPAGRLSRMLEATAPESLYATVAELFRLQGAPADAAVFDAALSDAVERVRGAVPEFDAFAPLLYKYDCTNIKIALKCMVQDIRTYRGFYTCGTVPAEAMEKALETGELPPLPPAMAAAAEAARLEYGKTGEARCIDLILDRACFEDMAAAAKAGGIPLIEVIVSMRADFANVLACLRIRESGIPPAAGAALFARAFVPGGKESRSIFSDGEEGCASLSSLGARMEKGPARDAVRKAEAAGAGFLMIERIFDEAVLQQTGRYRYQPFGPEMIVRYLVLRETELRNGRVIASRASTGVSAEETRERLCDLSV